MEIKYVDTLLLSALTTSIFLTQGFGVNTQYGNKEGLLTSSLLMRVKRETVANAEKKLQVVMMGNVNATKDLGLHAIGLLAIGEITAKNTTKLKNTKKTESSQDDGTPNRRALEKESFASKIMNPSRRMNIFINSVGTQIENDKQIKMNNRRLIKYLDKFKPKTEARG